MKYQIKNFKDIKDLEFELTPLHAFVGVPGSYDNILEYLKTQGFSIRNSDYDPWRSYGELDPEVFLGLKIIVEKSFDPVKIDLKDSVLIVNNYPTINKRDLFVFMTLIALPHLMKSYASLKGLIVKYPESCIYPPHIPIIMNSFRQLSNQLNVLLCTNSPLVLNECLPEEVSIVRRTLEETKVFPFRATKNFEMRSSIYALGELWVSHINDL